MKTFLTKLKFKLSLLKQAFMLEYFPKTYYEKKTFKDIKAFKNSINNMYDNKISKDPHVGIEINNTCNLNCVICATQQSKRKKGEMSVDLFERIVKEISALGQRHLAVHTVGEPFLYSNLPDVFDICKKYNIKLHLTTNGLLLHQHINLINNFSDMISKISFSIDGATKETYEKIRKGGNFERLIKNIELICEHNKKMNKNCRIPIALQAVISADNFNEIPLFFKLFEKYFSPEEMCFQFVSNLSASHGEDNYYKSKRLNTDNLERLPVPCKKFWHSMQILWDGDVSVCCRDYNGEIIVGNILNKSISDIWNNSLYEYYRKQHLKRDIKTMALCRDCWHIAPEAAIIVDYYIHYLFKKFRNRSNEFYLEKIRNKIEYLNNNYADGFVFKNF